MARSSRSAPPRRIFRRAHGPRARSSQPGGPQQQGVGSVACGAAAQGSDDVESDAQGTPRVLLRAQAQWEAAAWAGCAAV